MGRTSSGTDVLFNAEASHLSALFSKLNKDFNKLYQNTFTSPLNFKQIHTFTINNGKLLHVVTKTVPRRPLQGARGRILFMCVFTHQSNSKHTRKGVQKVVLSKLFSRFNLNITYN